MLFRTPRINRSICRNIGCMNMNTENVKIMFVIPAKYESCNETSDLMQQAFDACKQNSIDCKWYSEDECLKLKTLKTDFIVFEEFSGQTFENVKQFSKSVILGPWCLLICLTEGKQIPNFSWPIYSVAMIGCTIAFSSLTKQEKKELQEKVENMGGLVSTKLMESCTHLVTNSVKSEKYVKAAESGKKIMLSSWVNDVWEASLEANVHGTSEQFNRHVCPVFYNVVVCCTGLSSAQRIELRQLITDHGGVYKEQLNVHKTDILITDSCTQSAKYNGAKKYNIKCVTMKWVVDSIKNGYAMPDDAYHIKIGTSTPTKEGEELPNFSMISTIGNASAMVARNGMEFSETIDGTQLTKLHTPSTNGLSLKRKSNSNENNELVDDINLKEVKSAGSFLDGCGIYLAGFGAEQREKLCKILNFSGATRYNDISERVTHIIGDDQSSELKYLRIQNKLSCPVVSIHWLIASLSEKSPVDEEKYIIGTAPSAVNEPGSPLSKKSIHLLQAVTETKRNAPELSVPVPVENQEMDIIQHYLKPSFSENTIARILNADNTFENKLENTKDPEKSSGVSVEPEKDASSAIDDDSSQPIEPIFQGLKFFIDGFTPEEQKQVKNVIERMSGNVIPKKYKNLCDYAIVPTFSSILNKSVNNIVNDLWITECWHENEIRPIEYFHRPFPIDENVKPLTDCVLTISTYTNYERNFLKNLIMQLGGVYQELLSRIDTKNLKACTHLVSPEPTGKKYSAAVKWGLPVINKDWLLQCAQTSKYVSETSYLVGDAKHSLRSTSHSNDNNLTDKIVATTDKDITRSTSEELAVPVPKDVQLSQTPPTRTNGGSAEQTPLSRKWPNCGVTASQITPVQKIIAEARRRQLLGTPEQNLQRPLVWDHVDTPETPLEHLVKSDSSPNLRKQMCRFLNTFPDYKPRRNSTPLSELKRKLWDKICPQTDANTSNPPNFKLSDEDENNHPGNDENILTPPRTIVSDHIVNNKLKQLQEMLTASGGNRSSGRKSTLLPVEAEVLKDSQPNTVGWDECTQETHERPRRVFMFSGVDQDKRTEMIPQLEKLGANVSNSLNFDPSSTHLICTKPSRNEKILASMSSGKWILHESYVEQCVSDGTFVDEELFEFGNPKANDNIHLEKDNDSRLTAIHFWRKEIARRGYGAFHDMRFIVVAPKRDPLVRVLQAGGGIVIDESPPYTKTIHATHCLLDLKSGTNLEDYIPLAQQGILCINTMYVNDFLLKNGIDVRDYIIPYLLEYHQN